jgi:hypothetical protein
MEGFEMEITDIFKFDKFLSVFLIKIVYWIVGILIVLGTLAGMIGSSFIGSRLLEFGYGYGSGFSVTGAILSLIFGALSLVGWRVFCEFLIVVFSINDRLGSLVDLKKTELSEK